MKLEDITPTETKRVLAFVSRPDGSGGVEPVTSRAHPPTKQGELLRAARKFKGLHLGDTARALGLSVTDVSAIERGAMQAVDEQEFTRVIVALLVEGE